LIRTVAGRGYQFTGEIRDDETAVTPAAHLTNLPFYLPELIGRETSLGTVVDLITAHRFVTLTGAGGVGKTRLALEAARQLLPRFPDGAWLVDLGPLADPALVPGAVAVAVDVPLSAGPVTADRVAAAFRAKHALIVLDNCEHVIQAAASMADAQARWPPFAAGLTGSHSRSSSPRGASRPSASTALPLASATAFICSRPAGARRCRTSRLCARPSTGATNSCQNRNGSPCGGSPSSPAAFPWRRPPL